MVRMGMSFLSCSILLFRSAAVLRKNHFLEGKSSAAAGGSTGGAVIRGCDDAASFYDGKEDGRDG